MIVCYNIIRRVSRLKWQTGIWISQVRWKAPWVLQVRQLTTLLVVTRAYITIIWHLSPHIHRMFPDQCHGTLPWCFLNASQFWDVGETIESDPGAIEPCKGMDCLDVTVGRFFVVKIPPTALCQAIIALRGGAPFCPFEILMVGAQVQGDVPPLNKISEMPLIPLEDQKLSWEQPGHGDQVPISYPHWQITAHILKVGGWGVNYIELPLRATPGVIPCLCFRWWLQVTGHEAVSQQIQWVQNVWSDLMRWWCWSCHEGPGTLGSYSPSGGSGPLWWAGGCPYGDGSIHIGNSCSPEESGLLSDGWKTGMDSHQELSFLLLCLY